MDAGLPTGSDHRPRAIVWALLLVSLTAQPNLRAQVLTVSSDIACRACTAELEHLATLGTADGPGALAGPPAVVRRDSRGRLYVVQYTVGSEIAVFDSTGRFLRVLGRKGSGPGEFRSIRGLAVGPGDSLYVFDNGNHRQTVLSSNWEVARTGPLGAVSFVHGAERLHDGSLVLNASVATTEGIGQPLHLVNPSGEVERSFGAVREAGRPGVPWLALRATAAGSPEGVWVAPKTSYVIEHWNTAGSVLTRLAREADWFQPYDTKPVGTNEPPEPWLMGLQSLGDDQLAVLILVAAADYAERLGEPRRTPRSPAPVYDVSRKEELYDTVLEIFDVREGRLLLSKRFPQYLVGFLSADLLYGYRLTENGVPQIDTWRLRLVRPAR